MTKVTDDLFDKAINETSFAIPDSPKETKSYGEKKNPLVKGSYLAVSYTHLTLPTKRIV